MHTTFNPVSEISWPRIADDLWQQGFSRLGVLLSDSDCLQLRSLYADSSLFRTRIEMERYRFGRGEYQYFKYPLPDLVSSWRETLYAGLCGIANEWMAALKTDVEFPATLGAFLEQCRERGQTRSTPLVLRYRAGDYNCLHQDVYGNLVFPFQVVVALSSPTIDFDGGELLLVEQIPRAQSRGHAMLLGRGEAVVISTRYRPIRGARGFYRAAVRHGVSTIRSGERFTLGLVFHDSK